MQLSLVSLENMRTQDQPCAKREEKASQKAPMPSKRERPIARTPDLGVGGKSEAERPLIGVDSRSLEEAAAEIGEAEAAGEEGR